MRNAYEAEGTPELLSFSLMKIAVKNLRGTLVFHFLAFVTVLFWGTSFVSTKVLLEYEFSAVQIFTIRFVVTYLILLLACHRKFRCENFKHELILFICGITGCTLYFWTENTALTLSSSSNVSLIVCTNPLLIMIFGGIIYKTERLCKRQVLGCLVTFVGMVLVVLNGKFVLKVSPLGDFLAFGSALVWTIYSLVIKKLNGVYSTPFITRKVFFYGMLPVVSFNFLCLTVFSSLFGYLIWNKVLKQLGTVLASNYIYAIPLVTIVTAILALGERITSVAILGAFAIVAGMVLAEIKKK